VRVTSRGRIRIDLGWGGKLHQRNATIFAAGPVDRSPCGSGTAARVAVLTATGAAYRVGTSTFEVDPYDALVPGLVLR
jgi:proline racemase